MWYFPIEQIQARSGSSDGGVYKILIGLLF